MDVNDVVFVKISKAEIAEQTQVWRDRCVPTSAVKTAT